MLLTDQKQRKMDHNHHMMQKSTFHNFGPQLWIPEENKCLLFILLAHLGIEEKGTPLPR
jgi:hypothetical protein